MSDEDSPRSEAYCQPCEADAAWSEEDSIRSEADDESKVPAHDQPAPREDANLWSLELPDPGESARSVALAELANATLKALPVLPIRQSLLTMILKGCKLVEVEEIERDSALEPAAP